MQKLIAHSFAQRHKKQQKNVNLKVSKCQTYKEYSKVQSIFVCSKF